MSTENRIFKASYLIFVGAFFTGISSVVSGIVLFKVFLSGQGISEDVPVQVFFVVGVIAQLVIAIAVLLLAVPARLFKKEWPDLIRVLKDIGKFDKTAHMYAVTSALTGGLSIAIIVLPAYGKFGALITVVLYVTVPAIANGIVDLFTNVPRRNKPIFAVFLGISIVALFVITNPVVFSSTSVSVFFDSLLSNVELLLGMVVFYGILSTLNDQSLNSGINSVKGHGEPISEGIAFAFLRMFWLAVLGTIIGLSLAIGHEGLEPFIVVLRSAVDQRLGELILFVGIVQLAGVLINFAKAKLLASFKKTPSEVAVAFGISSIVGFGLTGILSVFAPHLLRDPTFDGSTFPQKLIATVVIIMLVYGLARFNKANPQVEAIE